MGENADKEMKFQSTHPVWDATYFIQTCDYINAFQSTHPVWDATRRRVYRNPTLKISIHASRMGCDLLDRTEPSRFAMISIHASRMGCDFCNWPAKFAMPTFQSTHPVWDATEVFGRSFKTVEFQSTHPVWDAT